MASDPREQEKEVAKALRKYFDHLKKVAQGGDDTPENSRITPLLNLLNETAKALGAPVFCKGHPSGRGMGGKLPDFSLHAASKDEAPEAPLGFPLHGVGEAKPVDHDIDALVESDQVQGYLELWGLVLATNFRQFRFLERKGKGYRVVDQCDLRGNKVAFEKLLAGSSTTAARELASDFAGFMRPVLKYKVPMSKVEDVARTFAACARKALAVVEADPPSDLEALKRDLQVALGMQFEDSEAGRHFFHSTIVQALFYGVFSAWVDHVRKGEAGNFNWRGSFYDLTLPVLKRLFQAINVSDDLKGILDNAGAALNRVDTNIFFKEFEAEEALESFYEPFLEHFDPDLRKAMGVWYTPREVVRYMVERVDRVLREELGRPDGLADESVEVLDPCCGTGTYIMEVLNRIKRTLIEEHGLGEPLAAREIKKAAMGRVHGFEIMPAPFVISHWRLNGALSRMGAPLDLKKKPKAERAAVLFANALTRWEPSEDEHDDLYRGDPFRDERDKADAVKQKGRILVVLGNPPYNAFAGTSTKEEGKGVAAYKKNLTSRWGIKKYNLDDLYIRFLRIAQQRIVKTGEGIVCYISNHSYIRGKSFVVMRENLTQDFDKAWIDGLNGDSRMTGKRTPDGDRDPSIFSSPYNKAGIQVGTAVNLLLRHEARCERPKVFYRDFWGEKKKENLLASLTQDKPESRYEEAEPRIWNWQLLRPVHASEAYRSWPLLNHLCDMDHLDGPQEVRGGALIDITRADLEKRMKAYCDPSFAWQDFAALETGLSRKWARFKPAETRAKLHDAGEKYNEERIIPYSFKPFDVRHAYMSEVRPVWNEYRPTLWQHYRRAGNRFLISRPEGDGDNEGPPISFTKTLWDYGAVQGTAKHIPFYRIEEDTPEGDSGANLSDGSKKYLAALGLDESGAGRDESIWMHALAIAHSPLYIGENADALRIDWPRVPLPKGRRQFETSAGLGRRIAAFMDTEAPVPGVTAGGVAEHLKVMAVPEGTSFLVMADWGRPQGVGNSKVMPGEGEWEKRDWTDAERRAIEAGLTEAGVDPARGLELLGQAFDVYANNSDLWRGVPEAAWNFRVGGNQVLKKWLSYRQDKALGRAMETGEVREFMEIVRRLAAIVLMADALDENYEKTKAAPYDWGFSAPGNISREEMEAEAERLDGVKPKGA